MKEIQEKMLFNRKHIKSIKSLFLILIPFLHLLINFWWDPFHEPLARNLKIDYILNWLFVVGYLLFIVLLLITKINLGYRILLALIFIPVFCKASISVLGGPEKQLDKVVFGNYQYHLTTRLPADPFESWENYFLYQCHIFGEYCIMIEPVIWQGVSNPDDMKLVIDENLEEIHVYNQDQLIFKYDPFYNW